METLTDEQLYANYGKLMVQQELLQGQINAMKLEINKRLNAPKTDEKPPEDSNA